MEKERLIQNSVANRIVQILFLKGDMTTLEIQKNISDVSQATVYRYVKLLEQYGFLRVSKEEKIRGQIEKTYCIEEISISEDLFLQQISLVLSDSEYDNFCGEIKEIIKKYVAREKTSERRVRNFYMISMSGEESKHESTDYDGNGC